MVRRVVRGAGGFAFRSRRGEPRGMRWGIRTSLVVGLVGLLLVAGGIAALVVVRLVGGEAEAQVLAQQRARAVAEAEALAGRCAVAEGVGAPGGCEAAVVAAVARGGAGGGAGWAGGEVRGEGARGEGARGEGAGGEGARREEERERVRGEGAWGEGAGREGAGREAVRRAVVGPDGRWWVGGEGPPGGAVLDVLQGGAVEWSRRVRGPDDARGAGVDHRVVVPVAIDGGRRAVLVVDFGLDGLHAAVAARQRTALAFLLVALLGVLAFAIYVSGRVLVGPVVALTQAVERVGAGGSGGVWGEAGGGHRGGVRGEAGGGDRGGAWGEAGGGDRGGVGGEAGGGNRGGVRGEAGGGDRGGAWGGDRGAGSGLPAPAGPAELRRLHEAFGAMLGRVQAAQEAVVRHEKLATVGRLAAGVAHEVGNPLAAVMGYVEYLRDPRGCSDELRVELLERVDRELVRMRDSLRRLLDFSRPTPAEPVVMRLDEVVVAAVELVRFQRVMAGVEVEVEVVGEAPVVVADPGRMRQVFVNLLLNAADAMGGVGKVRVVVERGEGGVVQATVRDEGPGVDAAIAGRIFDPFVTARRSGEGTGLGLAIGQRLVEEAGGRLWLASAPGEAGASFVVALPGA